MTQEEIIEYNKRCALFLDKKYNNNKIVVNYFNKCNANPTGETWHECHYHSDWNWIMEVVEAIEKKSECIIMGRFLYNSFDIGNRSIKFYYNPNNQYLLQLELKQVLSDEPWIHTMYKHHIIQEFDFKTKGKKEAVVQAINQFLIWNEQTKK